jgi:predicted Zn-dependent peptidase
MESPASYDKLNLDRSLAIYKEVFSNADGLHFTFVGNIDIDKMKTYITTYLGSLPARTVQHAYKDVGLRPVQGPLNLNVNKGAEKQSLVVLQYSGEMPYSKETDLQLAMLSEVMNIKIIEKLREEMGVGYYVRAYNDVYSDHGFFQISAGIDNKRIDEVLMLLKSSERVSYDIEHMFDRCKDSQRKSPDEYTRVLRRWADLLPSMEFRVFISSHNIVGEKTLFRR